MVEHLRFTARGEKPLLQIIHNDLLDELEDGVTDRESLRLIQVDDLHESLNHTITSLGSLTLYRSLTHPPQDINVVQAKQEAVAELRNNDRIRKPIIDYLENFKALEDSFLKFINDDLDTMFPYKDFKLATKAASDLKEISRVIPKPESAYLKNLADVIKSYEKSSVYQLMRGPIYKTRQGLKSKEEVRFWTLKRRFWPTSFGPSTIIPMIPFGFFAISAFTGFKQKEVLSIFDDKMDLYLIINLYLPMFGMMANRVKPTIDLRTFIQPLNELAQKNQIFLQAVDVVGKVDELNSFLEFSKTAASSTVTPKITDNNSHSFKAEDLRNPVLGKEDENFVPNAVDLRGLIFVTGPNSGGKTTICKTVVQSQLMAQIGCDILAKNAVINVATKIAYQAPKFDALEDSEGRFGTELSRTRDIFFSIGSKSLVVLDELAEGTTREEKMQVSQAVLNGFEKKGGTTVLVTHNHELVYDFKEEEKGQFLQVEFDGDHPTFKLVPGISTSSHADKIAQKIGFSEKDIETHLRDGGYL